MRYPSKTLIKNITQTPRTLSEANKDARYACAIQTFKSDAKLTLDFLSNALVGALWTVVIIGAVAGVVTLLTGARA
jgi:F0F1-type ATP synthase assembly protein I